MQWSDVTAPPSSTKLRQFAVLWLLFFVTLALWRAWSGQRGIGVGVLAGLGLSIGALGWIWPGAIRPLFTGWMMAAFPLGWAISRLILGLLFYGLFTFVALLFRMMGRDLLRLKRQQGVESYWMPKQSVTDSGKYLRQF